MYVCVHVATEKNKQFFRPHMLVSYKHPNSYIHIHAYIHAYITYHSTNRVFIHAYIHT
jgi:hypothetical protein